jgi:L-rhamnose isomerase / sugar isomerase
VSTSVQVNTTPATPTTIMQALKQQRIETPSWGYGNSGTRFKTFAAPGAARTVWEKLEDAAEVQRLCGIAPSVALHIPWDKPNPVGAVTSSDWQGLLDFAAAKNIEIGAINPNVFQDEQYKVGSIAHPDSKVRAKAIAHLLECVEIMQITKSRDLSLWFADGTNYAGQDDLRARKRRVRQSLSEVYAALPDGTRMLLEYKFFEPAFYFTDISDWGVALNHCQALGEKAQVLVDLGHHAQAVNIEAIVAFLLDEGRLGGFHFNARRYSDDDLIVGSTNPLELFCIYAELVAAERSSDAVLAGHAQAVAYMIDQSHNIEPKLEAMLHSVLNCQSAYAKALHIDFERLQAAQAAADVLEAHRTLMDAFETDVRPLLAQLRQEMGLPIDPIRAYRQSDYLQKVSRERGVATATGGFPT